MKKILLVNQDQKYIGDLQAKFARRYDVLATDNYATAYQLCRAIEIDLLLVRVPREKSIDGNNQLKKFLKKLKHKKFANITKILTAAEGGDYKLEEFLKYGIAALVINVEEMEKWLK